MNTRGARWTRPGTWAAVASLVAMVTVGAHPASAQTVQVSRPTLSVASEETETFLDTQFVRALAAAESTYEGLRVGYDGFSERTAVKNATVSVDVFANNAGDSSMLVLTGSNRDGLSESVVYQMDWHDVFYRELASMLGFFGAVLGGDTDPPAGELVYFQDFRTDYVATGDLAAGSAMQPYSLASRDGNLLVASGSFILETDRYFREQQKIGADAGLPGFWAMHVASTPAGTIAAASPAQSGVARLVRGIPQAFRLPTRNAVYSLAMGSDGTVFTLDLQQNVLRFGSDSAGPLDLGLPEGTFVSFMATGPEKTLYVWEPTQRLVLIYDSEGTRVGTIVPHVPFDVALGLKQFSVYPNGDLLTVFADRIVRVSRDGRALWEVHANDLPEIGGLGLFTQLELDPESGTAYLLNVQEKRIVQLLDLASIRETRSLADFERRILASNEKLRANPYDQDALAERAGLYEEIEAWEAAAYTWDTAYGINPMNNRVASAHAEVSLRRLADNAERLRDRAVGLLEQFGIASARYHYQQAQVEYEKLLRDDPENVQARKDLEALRRRFERAEAPQQTPPPLEIQRIVVTDLFPSLFARYQREPVGSVVVRNTGSTDATRVSLTAEMRFLEFATPGGSLERLGPGEEATLDVMLPISSHALLLEESTPVPVGLTITYEAGGRTRKESTVEIITVYRATALTWDDSAKLAAYVTPRDEIVESYAAPFVGVGEAERYALSEKIFRAARISDAVAASGLEYIEDPQSGITEVLGDPSVIDTVRFPRNTMRVGYGDCDDTTALLASLLESVGIATAIMTTPGHVFLAFDTGEPAQNGWLFQSDGTATITHNGTLWLPYETTILHQGFLASWREGSRLYARYSRTNEVEFIPIADERDRFPSLPLEPASFSVMPPPAALVDTRYAQSINKLRDTLYLENLGRLEDRLARQSGRQRARTLNQIGILHGQFAEARAAERIFRDAVSVDPDYAASYINLANLSLLAGRPQEALTWLDKADERRPGGILSTLLRAWASYLAGDRQESARQMAILEERAPDLAASYPDLAGGETASRASEAAARPSLPWAGDE